METTQASVKLARTAREDAEAEEHWKQDEEGTAMDPGLYTYYGCFVQQKRRVSFNSLPKMSEEMKQVLFSFDRMDVTGDGVAKVGETNNLRRNSEARNGRQKKPILKKRSTDSTKLPVIKNGLSLLSVGAVARTVQCAANAMKANLKSRKNHEEENTTQIRRSLSDTQCCSMKTRYLLERSANVYDRIDQLRENAKLTRSSSRRTSSEDSDTILENDKVEKIQSFDEEDSDFDDGGLKMRKSLVRFREPLRHASLDGRSVEDPQQGSDTEIYRISSGRLIRSASIA